MKPKSVIKLLISIIMLGLVLRMVDIDELAKTVLAIPPSIALMVVLAYGLGQCINTVKWWLIARSADVDVPYTTALRASFIGMFVNCFGFGLVGGDLARALLLAQGKPVKAPALASVVADRAHGLAILSGIGGVGILVFGHNGINPVFDYLLMGLSLSIVLGWFFGPSLVIALTPKESRFRAKVEQAMAVFPKDPGTILIISLVSVLFHLVQIGIHGLMGLGVGVSMSWAVLLVTVPFVNIVSNLPISWNGLGVRENAYIYFLCPQVLTNEQALAFGAMWLLSVTICSAIGGILSLLTNDLDIRKASEAEAQMSGGKLRTSASM